MLVIPFYGYCHRRTRSPTEASHRSGILLFLPACFQAAAGVLPQNLRRGGHSHMRLG